MNEWGIPDWREAAAYDDVDQWDFWRWRWEFYRRHEDLRACFDKYVEENYGKIVEICIGNETPYEANVMASVSEECYWKFGYWGIPNPRIGNQPRDLIFAPGDGFVSFHEGRVAKVMNLQFELDNAGVELTEKNGKKLGEKLNWAFIPLQEEEVSITFDMNRPLEPQLANAKRLLNSMYKDYGKKLQRRRDYKKIFEYLRTLDAREAMPEATWQEFTDALFSVGLVKQHADPAGGHLAPPASAGLKKWNEANALRSNF